MNINVNTFSVLIRHSLTFLYFNLNSCSMKLKTTDQNLETAHKNVQEIVICVSRPESNILLHEARTEARKHGLYTLFFVR